ncbi:hypothetical protein EFL95_10865 [Nocardioides marmorisolisilvae]|uniref:Uncharacterized protein n=1 Tax=Nocardioides marmorisolisilvae TaxID=1542737 RepID=A0A3N0DV33_9ACTN|nr:hypothetical protein EFL95_10865 [Nocardioides marmorisolisilvae]
MSTAEDGVGVSVGLEVGVGVLAAVVGEADGFEALPQPVRTSRPATTRRGHRFREDARMAGA